MPDQQRVRHRIPSGPRPTPTPLQSPQVSTTSIPRSTSSILKTQPSTTSLGSLPYRTDSPLDALLSLEDEYMDSPEISGGFVANAATGPNRQVSQYQPAPPSAFQGQPASRSRSPARGLTQVLKNVSVPRESSQIRSKTLPDIQPSTPTSFSISRPTTPLSKGTAGQKPSKHRPKPSRLNTNFDGLAPGSVMTSPSMISPGYKHWQQVRAHVMAPTPVEERPPPRVGKKTGLVSKAAGKFGFRHAADNVIGYADRRRSMNVLLADLGDLTEEEKEAITRERRKFARDIKTCLDACALEESRRRLDRIGYGKDPSPRRQDTKSSAASTAPSTTIHAHPHAAQRFVFDPSFSAFAPLLTELHKYLPAARSKRPWARTCPHHSEMLAELGVAFLKDSNSTDGEKQQALEVFGTIVKNWASDTAEEVLMRWQWLCRALLTHDRQIRNRGLPLLDSFLHHDPSLPKGQEPPHTALSFHSLASDLLLLLHSVETSQQSQQSHASAVRGYLENLKEGRIIQVNAASLVEVVDGLEVEDESMGGVEKELVWMAVASVLQTYPHLAPWLLVGDDPMIKDFTPPPLLGATPDHIPPLRSHSVLLLLTSLITLIRNAHDFTLLPPIWRSVEHIILPALPGLPNMDTLTSALAMLVFEMEVLVHKLQPGDMADDPFRDYDHSLSGQKVAEHRELMVSHVEDGDEWKMQFVATAKQVVQDADLPAVCDMIRSFLGKKELVSLGKECIAALFDRFKTSRTSLRVTQPLLQYLSSAHPHMLYKPLFTLSASTHPKSLSSSLHLVYLLSTTLGPNNFWSTDPQLAIIVLMGDSSPKVVSNDDTDKVADGKERSDAAKPAREVRLGRWAVIVEMIVVLESGGREDGKEWRGFGEGLEARLAVFLEVEENGGVLPLGYRALICRLLLSLRIKSLSVKRAPWLKTLIHWVIDAAKSSQHSQQQIEEDQAVKSLTSVYRSLSTQTETLSVDYKSQNTFTTSTRPGHCPSSFFAPSRISVLDQTLDQTIASLLVVVHSCLTVEDWNTLVPHLWGWYGANKSARKELGFMLEKCAEIVQGTLKAIMFSDLTSTHTLIRSQALHNLSTLFAWRNQILSQPIFTSRRGPLFHFAGKPIEFVSTEIGSSQWASPHDVHDAQLQKFGQTLPLELRQRLLELGWSDEEGLKKNKSDWEQMPVSALPALALQHDGTLAVNGDRSPSPIKPLGRKGSSGSGSSRSNKRKKPIFAPLLVEAVFDQLKILGKETDGAISKTSLELVRLLQRDDSVAFLRPLANQMSDDLLGAVERLNAVSVFLTPNFAFSALNAMVGFLKRVMKVEPDFPHWETVLTTIARLIPSVSQFSLRDIRKSKAEHVLLPASIHEEEGEMRIHAPWHIKVKVKDMGEGKPPVEERIPPPMTVQTAQLLILNESLKANPREVYLVKKMLAALPANDFLHSLSFSRAWLLLVSNVFHFINRNYNDRAELRHYLSTVGLILETHGSLDLLVTAHGMRIFMLCSSRFRRVVTSMGFSTIMGPVYRVYAAGNSAVRDCVEYAMRIFYKVHEDMFVYQACAAIADIEYDAEAVYELLSSLSGPNAESSGVSSGVKGLNDDEDMEALLQMLSGPEITISEIGKEASERRASKLASLTLEDKLFPRENIVRLFVTVIASNPATVRAANFLRLLSAMVPVIRDPASKDLLSEGVEALGSVISKSKTGDEASMLAFHPEYDISNADWTRAKTEYVHLVESLARAGGRLGTSATRKTLNMVTDLLRKQPESVAAAASSIVGELSKSRLASTKSTNFLREIAPLFRVYIGTVDFSGMLDSITDLIQRSNYDLGAEATSIIVQDYVDPAVKLLASASEDSLAFIVPMRSSTVKLLSVAVFLPGDALAALERHPSSASLLASLVFPLCLMLEPPREVDRQVIYTSLWIRILHYVLNHSNPQSRRNMKNSTSPVPHPRLIAATVILTVQIVKVVLIRGTESISRVKGLWTYVARRLLRIIESGDARFTDVDLGAPPRAVDWMMWSVFELVSLRASPLHIEFQAHIHQALSSMDRHNDFSRPSSPIIGTKSSITPSQISQPFSGRARRSSAHTQAITGHPRIASNGGPDQILSGGEVRSLSANFSTPKRGEHESLLPSPKQYPTLSPSPDLSLGVGLGIGMGHGRSPSFNSSSVMTPSESPRPSFTDLSARRASRPTFEAFSGPAGGNRFPSSAGVRNFGGTSEKAGGAIINLLGAPNHILAATSTGFPTASPSNVGGLSPAGLHENLQRGERVLKEVTIKSSQLVAAARDALRTVMIVHGWTLDDGEQPEMKNWSVGDALHVISDQTRIFVEEEFCDVFSPPRQGEWTDDTFSEKYGSGHGDDEKDIPFDVREGLVPLVSVSSP